MNINDKCFSSIEKAFKQLDKIYSSASANYGFNKVIDSFNSSLGQIGSFHIPDIYMFDNLGTIIDNSFSSSLGQIENFHIPDIAYPDTISCGKSLENICFHLPELPYFSSLTSVLLDTLSNGFASQDNWIVVSDKALGAVSEVAQIPEESIRKITEENHKTTLLSKEFLVSIIITIVCTLLPLIQTYYANERNALDTKKENIEASLFNERRLQIQKEQLAIEKEILECLQLLNESPKDSEESQLHTHECDCPCRNDQANPQSVADSPQPPLEDSIDSSAPNVRDSTE